MNMDIQRFWGIQMQIPLRECNVDSGVVKLPVNLFMQTANYSQAVIQ
jgi:hypothetical protein